VLIKIIYYTINNVVLKSKYIISVHNFHFILVRVIIFLVCVVLLLQRTFLTKSIIKGDFMRHTHGSGSKKEEY
jgi:hypothetical protein